MTWLTLKRYRELKFFNWDLTYQLFVFAADTWVLATAAFFAQCYKKNWRTNLEAGISPKNLPLHNFFAYMWVGRRETLRNFYLFTSWRKMSTGLATSFIFSGSGDLGQKNCFRVSVFREMFVRHFVVALIVVFPPQWGAIYWGATGPGLLPAAFFTT